MPAACTLQNSWVRVSWGACGPPQRSSVPEPRLLPSPRLPDDPQVVTGEDPPPFSVPSWLWLLPLVRSKQSLPISQPLRSPEEPGGKYTPSTTWNPKSKSNFLKGPDFPRSLVPPQLKVNVLPSCYHISSALLPPLIRQVQAYTRKTPSTGKNPKKVCCFATLYI